MAGARHTLDMIQERSFNIFEELDLPSAFENGLSGGSQSLRSLIRTYGHILEKNTSIQGSLLPLDWQEPFVDLGEIDIDDAISNVNRKSYPWIGIYRRMQSHKKREIETAVIFAIARYRAKLQAAWSDPDLFRIDHAMACMEQKELISGGWHVERHAPQEWIKDRESISWYRILGLIREMQDQLDQFHVQYAKWQGTDSKEGRLILLGITACHNIGQAGKGNPIPAPEHWSTAMSHALCLRRGWLTGDPTEPTLIERVMRPVRQGLDIESLRSYAATGDVSGIVKAMESVNISFRTRYTNFVASDDESVAQALSVACIVEDYLFGEKQRRRSFADAVFHRFPYFVIREGT